MNTNIFGKFDGRIVESPCRFRRWLGLEKGPRHCGPTPTANEDCDSLKPLAVSLFSFVRVVVMGAGLTFAAYSAEQSGYLDVTPSQRDLIKKTDDRATSRGLLRKSMDEVTSAPVAAVRGFAAGLDSGDLELASKHIVDAYDQGLPGQLQEEETRSVEAARQAIADAAEMLKLSTTSRPGREGTPELFPTIDGEIVRGADEAVKDIDRQRALMQQDAEDYSKKVLAKLPELGGLFDRLGITSSSLRHRISSRLVESASWMHRASLARINYLVLTGAPEVVRARYANGGAPKDPGAAPSSVDRYLESSKANKAF